jgi:hypothetical protein
MSFSLSGGVEVLGFISPTNPSDSYPVIDPLYGIDGFRNVNTITEMNSIPFLRRRAGMVVGVNGGSTYYKLNPEPWNYTITDWSLFDTYVTGGTVNYTGPNGNLTLDRNDGNSVVITGFTDIRTTGATLIGDTVYFDTNETLSAYTLDLSALEVNDTFVTGFTYNPSNNTFTISRNEGEPDLTASINTVSGLTVSNLTAGRVVYVGTGGLLTDETGFTYDESTNTLGVENIEASGNVTIQGDLTVLGSAISAFTSNLYVEDPNITLNYNPTGNTTVTSVNAGFTIQDGNGVAAGDVNFDVVRMQNLTGLTINEIPDVSEYTGLTGYANRGWITQLNDIVIRSTDVIDGGSAGDINGVRVLAEWDVLDGGQY